MFILDINVCLRYTRKREKLFSFLAVFALAVVFELGLKLGNSLRLVLNADECQVVIIFVQFLTTDHIFNENQAGNRGP